MAYSEPYDAIDEKTKDVSRAITSLREELEAVDWYNQRANTTKDQSLRDIMAHNRDEEIEHAAMLIEWLRRNMNGFDGELKTYLFTSGSLLDVEESGAAEGTETPSMKIGDLK
ncbi:MAG: ferritin-like domain-containing protein [Sphaerochaeta sp.]